MFEALTPAFVLRKPVRYVPDGVHISALRRGCLLRQGRRSCLIWQGRFLKINFRVGGFSTILESAVVSTRGRSRKAQGFAIELEEHTVMKCESV